MPLPSTTDTSLPPASSALVFDVCTASVVIRTVLLVEIVVAIGAGFGAAGAGDWLASVALLTAASLPATLLWLLAACSQKQLLQRYGIAAQYAAGAALGALCGLMGALVYYWANIGAAPVAWPACAAAGALLAAMVVTALQWRAQGRTPAATTARLAELQARIRPHFLFNALNSAIALVQVDPRKAESMLEDLSDLFRHALTEQGDTSTLGDEILLARRYLAIEQVRFDDRMNVQWNLDSRADAAVVPPLLLQPLVENAVKHGIEPGQGHGKIIVATRRRAGTVQIQIMNTAPPPGPAEPGRRSGTGIALANVRKRLRLLYDLECDFHTSHKNGHYWVRITIPA
ncbi:MAG: sensor histidine kinase [Comamonas sp.]